MSILPLVDMKTRKTKRFNLPEFWHLAVGETFGGVFFARGEVHHWELWQSGASFVRWLLFRLAPFAKDKKCDYKEVHAHFKEKS